MHNTKQLWAAVAAAQEQASHGSLHVTVELRRPSEIDLPPSGAQLKLRRKLEKKNALDQQLYDLAKADFYRRLCEELGECDGPPVQAPQPERARLATTHPHRLNPAVSHGEPVLQPR